MKTTKGVIFISNVTKALEHEWFVNSIDKSAFRLQFVLFNATNSPLHNYITEAGFVCKCHQLSNKPSVLAYAFWYWLKFLISRPDFVHCHLFEASLIGLSAGKFSGVKKRISTRHHSDFHFVYHPQAVKYDQLINWMSTSIIAVSKQVAAILSQQEGVPDSKITVIPHGIPESLMEQLPSTERIELLKQKYNLKEYYPVVGVVSRFVEWKGIQYIVPAFKEILKEYPTAKLVLANAKGNFFAEIESMLSELNKSSFQLISFEEDGAALMKTFDAFVHVPITPTAEAFGQVYLEALYLGVPMVCTLSGIAVDVIKDHENAVVVDYKNPSQIAAGLKLLLSDHELQQKLIKSGIATSKLLTFENKYLTTISLYL